MEKASFAEMNGWHCLRNSWRGMMKNDLSEWLEMIVKLGHSICGAIVSDVTIVPDRGMMSL
jgi:hypothetical protein